MPLPEDEDVKYDNEGYEDGDEGSDDDSDGDPPTERQQPYAAAGGGTVGVGGELNPEGGSEGIRGGPRVWRSVAMSRQGVMTQEAA